MASEKNPPPPDFDDAPELTDEEIKQLRPAREMFEELGIPMPVPRGRPKAEHVKTSVTIRLDADTVDDYKASGPGWQTRMNEDLREGARRRRVIARLRAQTLAAQHPAPGRKSA
ncbi:MAG: BrnA antitoxin family protein [Devosia sp.]